jgi:hypothetical protein
LREVAAKIARDPNLCTIKLGIAVMAMVNFVSIIVFAVMLRLTVIVVRRRVSVEVADAEVGTAASFNYRRVDRPLIPR